MSVIQASKDTIKDLNIFDILFNPYNISFWAGCYAIINRCDEENIKKYITDPEDAYLYYVYVEKDERMKEIAYEDGYDVTQALGLKLE